MEATEIVLIIGAVAAGIVSILVAWKKKGGKSNGGKKEE